VPHFYNGNHISNFEVLLLDDLFFLLPFAPIIFTQSFSPALFRPLPPFVRGTNLGFRRHGLEPKLDGVCMRMTADLTGNFTDLAQRVDHFESNATEHSGRVLGNLTDIGHRVNHLESDLVQRVDHFTDSHNQKEDVTHLTESHNQVKEDLSILVQCFGESAPIESRSRRPVSLFGFGRNGAILPDNVNQTVMVKLTDLNQAVTDVKQTVIDVKQTVIDVKQAVIDLKQTVLDVKQAVLDVNQTVVDVKQAILDVNQTAIEKFKEVNLSNANVLDEVIKSNANVLIEVKNVVKNVNEKLTFGTTVFSIVLAILVAVLGK
jgi:hypothetical protein